MLTVVLWTVLGGWIQVWADREDPYRPGDRAAVHFKLDEPGYVTVFRVDTDGRIRVLFPQDPWGDHSVRAGRVFAITGRRGEYAFVVDDKPGMGYILAIASPDPFDYRDLARGGAWDYRFVNGGRVDGDPYVALTDLAERITPGGDYDYDITPYHVGQRYGYPRFICRECHSQPAGRDWDEYRLECARFRLVIYDDPAYYPYRYSRGRTVVARPLHPGPRYVFRDANPGSQFVTRQRGRPAEIDRRRARELSPVRPLVERHRQERKELRKEDRQDDRRRRVDGRREIDDTAPRRTGEPELRRRRRSRD